jgi:hypothetical protein
MDAKLVAEHRIVRPAVTGATHVRLSPDGRRLAYYHEVAYSRAEGLYVAEVGEVDPEAIEAARAEGAPLEVQAGPGDLLLHADGLELQEIGWSPDGGHVACVLGPEDPIDPRRFVGWAKAPRAGKSGGPLGRASGLSFAWWTRGAPADLALLIADSSEGVVRRHSIAAGAKAETLAELRDDGSRRIPPRIVPSADGQRIAFTCRRMHEDVSELWIATADGPSVTSALFTQIPGAEVHVLPFWSPKGATLGVLMVHLALDHTGMIVVPRLTGEGDILHESDGLDGAVAPAWAPSGKSIAFFRADPAGGLYLDLLDPRTKNHAPATAPGALSGEPRFLGPDRLLVDGGPAAHLLTFATPP